MCFINSISYSYLINEVFNKYNIKYSIDNAKFSDAKKLYVCNSENIKIRPVANSFTDLNEPIPQIYIKDLFDKLSQKSDFKHIPFIEIFKQINWESFK